jgi:hypothetical protein
VPDTSSGASEVRSWWQRMSMSSNEKEISHGRVAWQTR